MCDAHHTSRETTRLKAKNGEFRPRNYRQFHCESTISSPSMPVRMRTWTVSPVCKSDSVNRLLDDTNRLSSVAATKILM